MTCFVLLFMTIFTSRAQATVHTQWAFQDIQLQKIQKPKGSLLIAIIDTGVDELHPFLKNSLWRNSGEIPANGIDDDQNGFVDDVYGWDFVKSNGRPLDRHGHGTHIAGLIHKVAPEAKFMVLKYYDPQIHAADTLRHTVAAIHYAVKMGAKIINYSGGGGTQSRLEYEALNEAKKKGVLVVAAAGNEGQNADQTSYYPANYDLSNILSITAHNPQRKLLKTSNYGLKSVDLSAPGEDLLSALPRNTYGVMTGTSQATALASAVAALLYMRHAELKTPEELIRHLLQTGSFEEKHLGQTRTARRLNAYRALALFDSFDAVSMSPTALIP